MKLADHCFIIIPLYLCTVFLCVAFYTVYDFFDEIEEFKGNIQKDLDDFSIYAISALEIMHDVSPPKGNQNKRNFDAIVRLRSGESKSFAGWPINEEVPNINVKNNIPHDTLPNCNFTMLPSRQGENQGVMRPRCTHGPPGPPGPRGSTGAQGRAGEPGGDSWPSCTAWLIRLRGPQKISSNTRSQEEK